MGQPTGSPEFGWAVALADLLLNPNRSSYRVDREPGLITMVVILVV
jgi:hypothetical protein